MIVGSTSTNIAIITTCSAVLSILGFFHFNFTISNCLIFILSFYVLNILGNWLMLHRYYSHKSFEFKYDFIRIILTFFTILSARGSPIGWAYIHRKHHRFSDTEKDPHSPLHLGLKLFGFQHYKSMESQNMELFLVKDLMNKEQIFIHKYYVLLLLFCIIPISLYSVELFYFLWILPITIVHLSQNLFNYFGHTYGYKNHITNDNSKNNLWLFPLLLGEAWHNNHHYNPKLNTTKFLKYEFDPLNIFIRLVKK